MDWTWRDACGGLGGGTHRGGGGDGWGGDIDILNWCNDNVANIILGMEINAPLAYDPRLELCHPNMDAFEGHGCRLNK